MMITLTCPGDEDPAVSWAELTVRWKRLHLRLERRFGRFEYVWVVEIQERGSPHLHVDIRGIRPSNAWLSSAARDVGFGGITDVSPTHRRTAGYLTYDRLNRPLTTADNTDAANQTSYTYSLTNPSWTDPTGTFLVTLDMLDHATSVDGPAIAAIGTAYRSERSGGE